MKQPQLTLVATLMFGLFGLLSAQDKDNMTTSLPSPMKGMDSMYKTKPMMVKESTLVWRGWKATGDEHHGVVNLSMGKIMVGLDTGEPLYGSIVVDMKSIMVKDIEKEKMNKKLEGHLKNEDFFEVDKYPTAEFIVVMVTPLGEGMHPFMNPMMNKDMKDMKGKGKKGKRKKGMDKNISMSMKDVTHVLSGWMIVKGHRKPMHAMAKVNMDGNMLRSISGKLMVDRTLFDVRYGSGKFFEDLGDKMIKDVFAIEFDLKF